MDFFQYHIGKYLPPPLPAVLGKYRCWHASTTRLCLLHTFSVEAWTQCFRVTWKGLFRSVSTLLHIPITYCSSRWWTIMLDELERFRKRSPPHRRIKAHSRKHVLLLRALALAALPFITLNRFLHSYSFPFIVAPSSLYYRADSSSFPSVFWCSCYYSL